MLPKPLSVALVSIAPLASLGAQQEVATGPATSASPTVPGPTVPELIRALPARPLALFAARDGSGAYQALRDVLLPVPASITTELRSFIFLGNQQMREFADGPVDPLIASHARGPAVLAAVRLGRERDLLLLSGCRKAEPFRRLITMNTQTGIHAVLPAPESMQRTAVVTMLAAGESHPDLPSPSSVPLPDKGFGFWLDLAGLDQRPSRWLASQPRTGWGRILMGPWLEPLLRAPEVSGTWTPVGDGLDSQGERGSGWRIRLQGARLQGKAAAIEATGGRSMEQETSARSGRPRPLPPLPGDAWGLDPLAVVSLDRSIAAVLQQPDRFLNAAGEAKVDQVIGTLEIFLGGRELLGDVLPMLGEPWTLMAFTDAPGVATEPDHGMELPFHLPHLALLVPLAEEAAATRVLNRGALGFLTVVNGQRKQQGKRGFRSRPITRNGLAGTTTWLPDWERPGAPPVEQGLTPTLVCGHGYAALCSTKRVAEAVMDALSRRISQAVPGPGPLPASASGDFLQLHGDPLARIINTNRDSLELQRVLEEGATEAEARRYVDRLAAIAGCFESVRIQLQPTLDGGISLESILRRPR